MSVIVFHNPANKVGKQLRNIIEGSAPGCHVVFHPTIASLVNGISRPGNTWGIAVLLPATRKDLHRLAAIGELLKTLRIILVLPDSRRDTISKGHALYPRYLTFADGRLENVGAVLKKMISSSKNHQEGDFKNF